MKQLSDLFTSVFTLAHRLDRMERAQTEQQRELKELAALGSRLASELARTNDELKRAAEREAAAREKFQAVGQEPTLEVRPAVAATIKRRVATRTGQDAYAEAHRILVEEEKSGGERGTTLPPEAFGQP